MHTLVHICTQAHTDIHNYTMYKYAHMNTCTPLMCTQIHMHTHTHTHSPPTFKSVSWCSHFLSHELHQQGFQFSVPKLEATVTKCTFLFVCFYKACILLFFFFFLQYWGLNSGPHACRQVLYHLSHSTCPKVLSDGGHWCAVGLSPGYRIHDLSSSSCLCSFWLECCWQVSGPL
jgi:hypothetical protein